VSEQPIPYEITPTGHAEYAALVRDAKRYRAIRSCHDNKHKPVSVVVWGDEPWEPGAGEQLDAVVDALEAK
jgi:hypothetical protein